MIIANNQEAAYFAASLNQFIHHKKSKKMKTLASIIIIAILGFVSIPTCNDNVFADRPDGTGLIRYSNGYLVHGSFEVLFTRNEYKCYGFIATDNFTLHSCKLCKRNYCSQPFKDTADNEFVMYSNSSCTVSGTKYHDNLKLGDIYPCACHKEVFVKDERTKQ
jgi:hypothetical protein